jgi:hypothetical protein
MSGLNSSNPVGAASKAEAVPLTVHAMPPLDMAGVDAQRRTRFGRWQLFLVLLACAAPVIASYFTYYVIRPEGRTNHGTLVLPPRPWPAQLTLTDLQGQAVPLAALKGQWLLVVAAPAACSAACEKMLYVQRQLREMTGRERDRIDKVWLVTDAGAIDAKLLAAVTSAPATRVLRVDGAAAASWLQAGAGSALEGHLYVVDPRGDWMLRSPVDLQPPKFKRDIDRLLRASAFWDQPGRGPNGEPAP